MTLKQDSSVILNHLVWLSSCSTKIIFLDYLAGLLESGVTTPFNEVFIELIHEKLLGTEVVIDCHFHLREYTDTIQDDVCVWGLCLVPTGETDYNLVLYFLYRLVVLHTSHADGGTFVPTPAGIVKTSRSKIHIHITSPMMKERTLGSLCPKSSDIP